MTDFGTECILRLKSFYDLLPDTSIKFLFFSADDMTKPKIKTNFKKWSFDKTVHYLTKSIHCGPYQWGLYVYRKTDIKYFVTGASTMTFTPNATNDVMIVKKSKDGDVNHGDHLTFLLFRQRTKENCLVKTHLTKYQEGDLDTIARFDFERDVKHCNFIMKKTECLDMLKSLNTFKEMSCERGEINPSKVFQKDKKRLVALYNLCKQVFQIIPQVAGNRKTSKKPFQKGGFYKDITFMSDTFIRFLTIRVFQKVKTKEPLLENIQVFFDEQNELGPKTNHYIIVVYDFHDYRNVFYLDTTETFVSCYVEEQMGHTAYLTQEERRIHREFMTKINTHPYQAIDI